MKNTVYPSWMEIYKTIVAHLNVAGKRTKLVDYNLAGSPTNMKVKVKEPDSIQASQPYTECWLLQVQDGWDSRQRRTTWMGYRRTR